MRQISGPGAGEAMPRFCRLLWRRVKSDRLLGLGDVSTVAFTPQGVENLKELLADRKN
jgi:hypothetical protein